jgi:hypothetical protein
LAARVIDGKALAAELKERLTTEAGGDVSKTETEPEERNTAAIIGASI